MPESFLVIGSNSFSGSHFVKQLLEKDYKVIGVSRSLEPHEVFLPYKSLSKQKNFEFKQIDLNHNLADLLDLIHLNKVLRHQSPHPLPLV